MGKRTHYKSFGEEFPEDLAEWNYEKNGVLKPEMFSDCFPDKKARPKAGRSHGTNCKTPW